MMSATVDGKVLDIKYRKLGDKHYSVWLGERLLGQIFKLKYGWDVVSAFPTEIGVISGLKSRWKATDLLLKIRTIKYSKTQ
jgi:hypothetical protein